MRHSRLRVFRAGLLALTVFAGTAMGTAQAAAVSVAADLHAPFAEDQTQASGANFSEYAYARAQAGYGFGKLVAHATTDWNILPAESANTRSAQATAAASFTDTLTIDSSVAPAGELGVLWFDVLVTFTAAFDQDSRGSNVGNLMSVHFWTYWDRIMNGSVATVGGFCNLYEGNYADPGLQCDGFTVTETAPGSYEARGRYGVQFLFGEAFSLAMRSQAIAAAAVGLQNADTGGFAGTLLDAGNSIYWDGIADVTWNDQSVPYTLRAQSGSDYRSSFAPDPAQQVPEPSTALLLAAAVALLAHSRRRARRAGEGGPGT